jgi:hypothetical protein
MEISELLIEINSHLRQAGFINDADELHNAILIEIAMRCHVKWLGDYYLPHLSQKDWWGKLENLSRATKKHMRRI